MTLEQLFEKYGFIGSIDRQFDSKGYYYQIYDSDWKCILGGKQEIRTIEDLYRVVEEYNNLTQVQNKKYNTNI